MGSARESFACGCDYAETYFEVAGYRIQSTAARGYVSTFCEVNT